MKKFITTLAAVACVSFFGSSVFAQGTTSQKQMKQQKQSTASATRAGNLDDKTMGTSIRASQLIGMNIQNAAGEGVGEINDLVLDARTGEVNYAAVTYGGFIGIGNKMHAVPFEAFKFTQDPDDKDDTVLVLNVTQNQMEGETGFDEDNWPNFADKTFTAKLYKRYDVKRHRHDAHHTIDHVNESTHTKSDK